ncbi:phage tail assembly protein [Chitinibacteraceae bacterium HSL-7]
MTHKLKKPVTAFGEPVTEITLREPLAGDLIDLGMPFGIPVDGKPPEINTAVVGALIGRLGNVPDATVRELAPADFTALLGKVVSFFV